MSLVSLQYYLFVLISLFFYYSVFKNSQWVALLLASIGFYYFACGTPWTVVYLCVSILISWTASIAMVKNGNSSVSRCIYIASVVINIGLLFALKYINFILRNINIIHNFMSSNNISMQVEWPASLGISFYTLQIVSYLTDCYWGISKPEKNIAKIALYTSFFAHMISGPISRYNQLSTQLFRKHDFHWANIENGIIRIIIGLFKKLVLAENLNSLVNYVFNSEKHFYGIVVILGIVAYVIQIYADFSGCMDIVLGTASCFGITMQENFEFPFSSRSIQEFWQRWHITLGLWLRDYIMYPLLRSNLWQIMTRKLRKKLNSKIAKAISTYTAMLVLWFCMGLWHGGGWNYIVEGIWFWLVIVVGKIFEPVFLKFTGNFKSKIWNIFQCTRTSIIYAVGAVFFRTDSVKGGFTILHDALSPQAITTGLSTFRTDLINFVSLNYHHYIGVCSSAFIGFIGFIFFSKICKKYGSFAKSIEKYSSMVQLCIMCFVVYLIILFGSYGPGYDASTFIYGGF